FGTGQGAGSQGVEQQLILQNGAGATEAETARSIQPTLRPTRRERLPQGMTHDENMYRGIGDRLLVHASVIKTVSEAHLVELFVIAGAEVGTSQERGEAARGVLPLGIDTQSLCQLTRGRGKLTQAFEHDCQMIPMTGARAFVSYGPQEALLGQLEITGIDSG